MRERIVAINPWEMLCFFVGEQREKVLRMPALMLKLSIGSKAYLIDM